MPQTSNPLASTPRRKASASPFSTLQRRKPSRTSCAGKDLADRLDDTGSIPSLAPAGVRQDVLSLVRYIQQTFFDPLPEIAGMNSERISEVLRFRESLPPIVSLAQLHAIAESPTDTERELARLIAQGVVRKLVVPGRGRGGERAGEGVVVVEDWKAVVGKAEGLEQEVKDKYLALLDESRGTSTVDVRSLEKQEVQALVRAGFLTNPSAVAGGLFAAPGTSSLLSISSAGSTAPTGSLAAVGGVDALHSSGGSGSALATQPNRPRYDKLSHTMTLSLPGTGAYLALLISSRSHLLSLLKQISPRFKESTVEVLREKWEGNVLGDAASVAKRARGEWRGVLPGRTKKWREFWGRAFQGVLAEAVGMGAVEVFGTGMGSIGVRAR